MTAPRSRLVQVIAAAPRLAGRVRRLPPVRWVLGRAGRHPDLASLTAACRQCGDVSSVHVLRLWARRARYWCGRCRAVVTETDLSSVRSIAELRSASPRPVPDDPAAGLREVMPEAMLRWATAQSRRPLNADGLDKAMTYQLYQRWDAHLAKVGDGRRPALPGFSTVVGALHDACYREGTVIRELIGSVPGPPPVALEALSERVAQARRWLALHGITLCWIVSRLPAGRLAVPDPADVKSAAEALRLGKPLDLAAVKGARAALFGTDGGPALRTLLEVYPEAEMLAALRVYLDTGRRPLRDDVLAHLTAPLNGPAAR